MELGLEFDDDDLIQEKKPKKLLTSYNARICSPEWFLDDCADIRHTDKATLYKFRGDYYYRLSDYAKAIDCFSTSLDSLNSQNRTMRREITDSLSRCFLCTGNTTKANQLADKVMEDCLTRDQTYHGLILKHLIHQKSGQIRDEVLILYQLIHLHPRNVQFWLALKNVYERIHDYHSEILINQLQTLSVTSVTSHDEKKRSCSSGENVHQSNSSTDEIDPNSVFHNSETEQTVSLEETVGENFSKSDNLGSRATNVDRENQISSLHSGSKCSSFSTISGCNKPVLEYDDILTGLSCQLLTLTCCVRIRLLLQSVQGTVASFIKEKNQQLQCKIGEDICSLAVEEGVLRKVNEFMKKDVFDDDNGENKNDGIEEDKEIPTFTAEEFNRRWFSWISYS